MNKIDFKKLFMDNGIIIVLLALVLYTGFTRENFFSFNNLANISVNKIGRAHV